MANEPRVIRSADRFTTGDVSGITSRHLLSFGAHYDPDRIGIGPLIAHNEERVAPGAGFDEHRHARVEIVTWVVSGSLRHDDSTGQSALITPGMVQRLDAGSGVMHAESNAATEPGESDVRFIQAWLRSHDPKAEPSHVAGTVDTDALRTSFAVAASGAPELRDQASIPLNRPDATLYAARLGPGDTRDLSVRGLCHFFVVDGEITVADNTLATGDSLVVTLEGDGLTIAATTNAEVLVWVFDETA